MIRTIFRFPRAAALAAALSVVALAGCGGAEALGPVEEEPSAVLSKLDAAEALCSGDWCGYHIKVGTTHPQTGEKVADQLRISGNGKYPPRVWTTLPDGAVWLFWQFPYPPGEYKLYVCPGVGGGCLTYTAIRPEGRP